MQDEIFGPILPVLTIANADEAVKFVQEREKPLALYVFTKRNGVVDEILARTSSGTVCVNDCVLQVGSKLTFFSVLLFCEFDISVFFNTTVHYTLIECLNLDDFKSYVYLHTYFDVCYVMFVV